MKNKKTLSMIYIIIGIVLIVCGLIFLPKFNDKENDNNEPSTEIVEEAEKYTKVIDGIEYTDISIKNRDSLKYLSFKITNITETVLNGYSAQMRFVDYNSKKIAKVEFNLPSLNPSESKIIEVEYDGDDLPNKYKIYVDNLDDVAESG